MDVLTSILRNKIIFTLLFLLTATAALTLTTAQTSRAQTDVNLYSGGGGGGGGGAGGAGGGNYGGGSASTGGTGNGGDGGDVSTLYSGNIHSGTTGGDGGANSGSGGAIGVNGVNGNYESFTLSPGGINANLNILAGDGGDGGNGGQGGQGGQGGSFSGQTGSQGFTGGNGGVGGYGGDISVSGSNLGTFNVTGDINIIAGNGGNGGNGGTVGAVAVSSIGGSNGPGSGGNGGQGGDGGNITVYINAETLTVGNDFNITGGDSGQNGITNNGSGGIGASGGNVTVTIDAEKLIIGNDLNINGGNGYSSNTGGAAKFTANDAELNGNLSLTSGSGTNSGDAELDMSSGRLLVTGGTLTHDFIFTRNSAMLTVTIDTLEIAANNTVDMTITNNIIGTDNIDYGILILQKGSALATTNFVGADYVVTRGLRVHTIAEWTTAGIWDADYLINGITMMYDMTEVNIADQTMLFLTENGGTGIIDLVNFDPVAQHNDPYADPFITSAYELKRLHLGTTVLADNSQNGQLWANQHTADYFGYNAGLRRYYFEVDGSGSSLLAHNFATADGYRVYLQGHLAGLANTIQTFWNTSSPLIKDASQSELDKFTVGLRTGASHIKHNTGSYAEIDNVSVAASASYKFATAIGHTTAGLMAEYGHGNYDVSSNIWGLSSFFSKYNLIGTGDTDEFGLGVFARNNFPQGSYIEASLRGGRISTDFKTKNWPYSSQHRWDNDTNYWSGHLGIGHETKIAAATLLDIYAKALWSNIDSSSFTTDFGEHVKLDSVNSVRSRVGARVTQNLVENQLKAYVGGAWEHEFDAKAKGRIGNSVIGYDAISDAPDLKGSSFMGELGLSYQPAETKISFDAGLFGLAGKQDGYGGYVGVKFAF